jgi:dihydroxyacid dehydratase/phosphogluconate dehydratase
MWYSGNPCNMHLLDLNKKVKKGVEKAGLVGMQFNTIGVRYVTAAPKLRTSRRYGGLTLSSATESRWAQVV